MPDDSRGLRAVIFDFDDTLANSLPARVAALQRCLTEHFARMVSAHEATAAINSASFIDQQLRGALGDDDPAIPALVDRYRQHYYDPGRAPLEAYGGIQETLAELAKRNVVVALVTSRYRAGAGGNPTWSVLHELERMGLLHHFQTVVGFEDTPEHKPSAQPFAECSRRLGVPNASILAVGDTPFDILGARAAGMVSAAALWGATDQAALLAATPDVILAAPPDLLAHL